MRIISEHSAETAGPGEMRTQEAEGLAGLLPFDEIFHLIGMDF